MYANCPKCGHAPLPADQSSPAACPACGIILAKFAAKAAAAAAPPPIRSTSRVITDDELEDEPPLRQRIPAMFSYVPDQVFKPFWMLRIAVLVVLGLWTLWIWSTFSLKEGHGGSTILHLILLPFHEAGHVFLRWAPRIVVYAGGTLGQWAMPIVLAVSLLWKRSDPYGASLFGWLLGFSLMDAGIYMYDAYDPHIMLLTGYTGAESENHDFIQVFGDLELLNHARGIGWFFALFGAAVMVASIAWGGWLLRKQYANITDNALAETDS
jgi:hypothetical protein